jgi:hypothetical protein
MELPLAIDPVNATFFLAIIVLIAAVGLAIAAAALDSDDSKQLFAIVGVLLGLFGAGGLGSLFINQAADEAASSAADKAAPQAANAAANRVANEETASPGRGQGRSEKTPNGSSKNEKGEPNAP